MDSLKQKDTEKLISSCLNGDRKSQALLYKALYGKMLAVCARYAENKQEAKDIFHDGMIKVFNNLGKFEFKGSFEGWVRKIMVNNAIDYLRTNLKDNSPFDENVLYEKIEDEQFIDMDDENIPKINPEKIIEFIQFLSPSYKTVFNLYVIENYTHRKISEMLGISVGTSKSNLAKAKLQLRKLLKKEFVKIEGHK